MLKLIIKEILYMTNKMQLIMIFIINNALHVSGGDRPGSSCQYHKLHIQFMSF
jgi:hypothetical protein